MKKLMTALLLAALAASLAGNYFLFRKAMDFYAREAAVRMNPVNDRFAEQNAALASKPKRKPRVIVFGESRAAMWNRHAPRNWGDLQIVNRGIGGETTPQIKRRLQEDVIALSPDLVILQMGDNDLKTMAVLPGTRDRAIETTYRNIVEIARELSDRGIEVLVTTIFPPGPVGLLRRPLWSTEVNDAIDFVNLRLLQFTYPRVEVVDCDLILRDGEYIRPDYSLDTLHLSADGYHALNLALEPTVKAILSR